jgi:hypothetical protein
MEALIRIRRNLIEADARAADEVMAEEEEEAAAKTA